MRILCRSAIQRVVALFLIAVVLIPASTGAEEPPAPELTYLIDRYIDVMGGRAALRNISSVRMRGFMSLPDGRRFPVSILKKAPDRVLIVQDTGPMRLIYGYNGAVVWFARQTGNATSSNRLEGPFAHQFIRSAPLANVLIEPGSRGAALESGPDTEIARVPCHTIVARFPDGSRSEFLIEKETFLERRQLQYNAEGRLVTELIPGNFQSWAGVRFAMQQVHRRNGQTVSTLVIESVEINLGLLDAVFDPPAEK